MMRLQVYMWAFMALALSSFSKEALSECISGDTIGCVPFKTVECPSNRLDINFVLDRSGSMSWGINCETQYCGQLCPVEFPQSYTGPATSCYRQDIMRMLLRDVLKQLFLLYQRDCIEYLVSDDARIYGSCEERGFTSIRYNLIWWFTKASTEYLDVEFSPYTSNENMGKSFKNYFYNPDGTIIADKWNTVNGVVTMKDDAIDNFFDRELLKGSNSPLYSNNEVNNVDPWPVGGGGTYSSTGVTRLVEVLQSVFKTYDDLQKLNARFPVFMMTDGVMTASDKKNMEDSTEKLKVLTGNVDQVALYGLGLTDSSNGALKASQQAFHSDYGFTDEISVPTATGVENVELYFSDEATAAKVISALFKSVNEGCQECYVLDNVKKCVGIGEPAPSFDTNNNGNTTFEEPNNVPDSALEVLITQTTLSFDKYIGIGNDVFKMPKDTIVCSNYYGDGNGNNAYPQFVFVDTNEDGKCSCCEELTQPCLCELAATTVIETRTITIGSGDFAYDQEIDVYDVSSNFAGEVSALSSLNVTDTLPLEATFNNSLDDRSNTGSDNDDSTGGATRIASFIGLVALPMMAAIM